MKVKYARVSINEQDLSLQLDALREAGCKKTCQDQVNGVKAERPGLQEALPYLLRGDTPVVWGIDRLGRSL